MAAARHYRVIRVIGSGSDSGNFIFRENGFFKASQKIIFIIVWLFFCELILLCAPRFVGERFKRYRCSGAVGQERLQLNI